MGQGWRVWVLAGVVVGLCVGVGWGQAAKDTRRGENMPTEAERAHPPKSWIDKDTGHRVVRLTEEPGSGSMYFNVNGYTPAGNEMIYTTPEGVGVLDLGTLKTRTLLTGKVRVIEAGHRTPSVFYIKPEERALYVTNIDTGETKMLAKVPERGSISTINADETMAAGTFEEGPVRAETFGGRTPGAGAAARPGAPAAAEGQQAHPMEQAADKGEMMVRRLAARIPLVLFAMDLRTGAVKPLIHSTDWIGHMLFSPTDPAVLMYCHEGPWHEVDRIWTIRTDGTENTLRHQRRMRMEIAGHEFWGKDGQTIYYDLQTPKGEDFFLASLNLKTGARTWYHMDRNEWSIHFNVNKDATLFTGDGGDKGQVAKASGGEWIYLFRPEKPREAGMKEKDFVEPAVLRAEKLVNMGKHNYALEPNVSFTPDGKMVVFRSNMFGAMYVFGVEVGKAS